jgi:hypothetical protein
MIQGVALLVLLTAPAKPAAVRAEVRVTQKLLVPACLNGTPLKAHQRRWRLEQRPHVASFTMGGDPAEAGYANVRFTPEGGHKYEIEVRTQDAMAFAKRAFPRGSWKPVVRDRTADRIVSDEPEWSDAACPAAGGAASPSR